MLADATEEQFDRAKKPPKSAEDETAETPLADAMPDEAEADQPANSANNAEEIPEPSRRDGPMRHPSRGALETAATDDDDDDAVTAEEEANAGEGDARREKGDVGAELGEVNAELITDLPMAEAAEEEGDEPTLEAMQVCTVRVKCGYVRAGSQILSEGTRRCNSDLTGGPTGRARALAPRRRACGGGRGGVACARGEDVTARAGVV